MCRLFRGGAYFEGRSYLKIIIFLKNDNKEMSTVKLKNVIHCLVLVGKIPDAVTCLFRDSTCMY